MLEFRLCRLCGTIEAGHTLDRPTLERHTCGGGWRVLTEPEVDELCRLPPWQLTPFDTILCIFAGIDPELDEVS